MISMNEYDELVNLLKKAVEPQSDTDKSAPVTYNWQFVDNKYKWHDTKKEVPDKLETVEATFSATNYENKKYFYNKYCLYVPNYTAYDSDFSDHYDLLATDVYVEDDVLYVQSGWYEYNAETAEVIFCHTQPNGWRYIEHYGENK